MGNGKVDQGLRLLEEMKSCGIKPNAITYSTLLLGLCDFEHELDARTNLKEMAEKQISPTDNSIFPRLMSGQCKVGDLDAALDVLKAMIRLSIPIESCMDITMSYGVLLQGWGL